MISYPEGFADWPLDRRNEWHGQKFQGNHRADTARFDRTKLDPIAENSLRKSEARQSLDGTNSISPARLFYIHWK
jgi:hypothetical protein